MISPRLLKQQCCSLPEVLSSWFSSFLTALAFNCSSSSKVIPEDEANFYSSHQQRHYCTHIIIENLLQLGEQYQTWACIWYHQNAQFLERRFRQAFENCTADSFSQNKF